MAQHNHESVSIFIDKPKYLSDQYPKGVTPNRPAFFGFPQYLRGSVTGVVVYSVPGNRNACIPIDKSLADQRWPKMPVILMVDRGNCTFVTKVKNAEAAGADACIVVDNIIEAGLPYMADDGTGDQIFIPSLFIRKEDGDNIKEALKKEIKEDSHVLLQLNWVMPNPDDTVEWEFWHVPDDKASRSFINSFQHVAKSLDNRVTFTPHFFFHRGEFFRCKLDDHTTPCGDNCTNHGRYCFFTNTFSLTTNVDSDVKGAAIVEESIRQLCLWKIVNHTEYEPRWWDYVLKFEQECWSSDRNKREQCSLLLVVNLFNINIRDKTMNCIQESGGYGHLVDKENTIVEKELSIQYEKHIRFIPTIRVNEVVYRGSLSCPKPVFESSCGVLSAICAGFSDGTMPDDCRQCGVENKMDFCGVCEVPGSSHFNQSCTDCLRIPNGDAVLDNCGVCQGPGRDACGNCYAIGDPRRQERKCSESSELSVGAVIAIVLISVVVVGFIVYFFMRRQKNELRANVDSLLKQYLPIDSQNADGGDGGETIVSMVPERDEISTSHNKISTSHSIQN